MRLPSCGRRLWMQIDARSAKSSSRSLANLSVGNGGDGVDVSQKWCKTRNMADELVRLLALRLLARPCTASCISRFFRSRPSSPKLPDPVVTASPCSASALFPTSRRWQAPDPAVSHSPKTFQTKHSYPGCACCDGPPTGAQHEPGPRPACAPVSPQTYSVSAGTCTSML